MVRSAAGFTLVEMLVALVVFAIIAAAGVALLRNSVDMQAAVERRLADVGAATRLRAVLASDISQAAAPAFPDGAAPAFAGTAGELTLLRLGWTDTSAVGRPELQAVHWTVAGDRLVRRAGPGGTSAAPDAEAVLTRGVAAARFRYRGRDGGWSDGWSPAAGSEALPAAIELVVQRRGEPEVAMIFALPDGPRPDAEPAAPGSLQPA